MSSYLLALKQLNNDAINIVYCYEKITTYFTFMLFHDCEKYYTRIIGKITKKFTCLLELHFSRYSMTSPGHIIQTLLHVVQSTASYILMLVFMTYNVWLCLALVLGLAVGYFFFGWRKNTVVDVTEHCQ